MQSAWSGLGHLNDEARESAFGGGIGHPGKAVRSFLLPAPPTQAEQGALPTRAHCSLWSNTPRSAYVLEEGARSPSPGAHLAHLRTPGMTRPRPLTQLTVDLNLSGLLLANQTGMILCSQPSKQLPWVSGQCGESPVYAWAAEWQSRGPGNRLPSPEPQSIYSHFSPSWRADPRALLPAGTEGKEHSSYS